MVIVFLVCSIVTFIVMLGIIVIHERIIVNSRLPFKRLRLKVKGVASIAIRRSVLTGIIVVVFSLLAGGLVFVAVSRTMPVQHYLYRWQETVTSDIVANGLLGVIFGGLFAAWLSRTYRKPADEKLTFIQKIEAVTLLLLFVIGTTSVSFEELIRSFRINDGGFAFQLPASKAHVSTSGQGANAVGPGQNENAKPVNQAFLDGFGLIWLTPSRMVRDQEYIKTFRPKSTKNASENSKRSDEITRQHRVITEEFETLFSPFVNCVAYSLIESGDRRYLFSQMSPIRPLIGAIYTNLIRIDDLKQKNGNEDDINAARKRLSIVISELNGDRINRNVTMPIRNYASYFGIKNCDGVKRFSIPLEIENSSISALPYLATIYASLLYMDGQKQEAIDTINEYIIHLREHNGNFDVDMPEYWYLSRAMVNLFYMAEDFIQSEEKEIPLRIRNLYLDNLDEYFALIKKIDERIPFQQIFSDYKFGGSAGHSLVEVKFRANPGFLKSCPNDEDSTFRELPLSVKDYATFSYIYLTLQSLYTFRSLDRPDFDTVGHLDLPPIFVEAENCQCDLIALRSSVRPSPSRAGQFGRRGS